MVAKFGLQNVAGRNGDNGSSAGVGIRDTSGQTNGRNLQCSFNPGTALIMNGEAILVSAPTPEPSTFALYGLGCLALVAFRQRR